MTTKYFNPYTDFGFKKLFGEEGSKDLLILNEPIFQKGFEIAEISHLNIDQYEQYKKSLVPDGVTKGRKSKCRSEFEGLG